MKCIRQLWSRWQRVWIQLKEMEREDNINVEEITTTDDGDAQHGCEAKRGGNNKICRDGGKEKRAL